jgi:Uma2 family endonuclease
MTQLTAIFEHAVKRRSAPGDPTWEMTRFYPTQGSWTEAEYLSLNTNELIEFSDGFLEFLPMATPFHQAIVLFLSGLLDSFVRANVPGEVFVAPCPVRTVSGHFREPDIFYVRPERLPDRHQPPKGADLGMEVVSGDAEDRKRDLVTKRGEYAQAQIPEYWIVDPKERTITVLILEGTTYREHNVFGAGTRATSMLLSGFSVSIDEVFAAGEGRR